MTQCCSFKILWLFSPHSDLVRRGHESFYRNWEENLMHIYTFCMLCCTILCLYPPKCIFQRIVVSELHHCEIIFSFTLILRVILSSLFNFSVLGCASALPALSYNCCLPSLQRTVWRKASTSSGHSPTSLCSFMSPKAKRKLPALEHPISIGLNFFFNYVDQMLMFILQFVGIIVENNRFFPPVFDSSVLTHHCLGVQKKMSHYKTYYIIV